jgi:hypothetical protein
LEAPADKLGGADGEVAAAPPPKCKVVETKPTETTWIQVGPAAFKTQAEAEKQIKTVCVEK